MKDEEDMRAETCQSDMIAVTSRFLIETGTNEEKSKEPCDSEYTDYTEFFEPEGKIVLFSPIFFPKFPSLFLFPSFI